VAQGEGLEFKPLYAKKKKKKELKASEKSRALGQTQLEFKIIMQNWVRPA
jgi:hypothetical protein